MALVALLSAVLLAILLHYFTRGRIELLAERAGLEFLRQTTELEENLRDSRVAPDAHAYLLLDTLRFLSDPKALVHLDLWTMLLARGLSRTKPAVPTAPVPYEIKGHQVRFITTLMRYLGARHPFIAFFALLAFPFITTSRNIEDRAELIEAVSRKLPGAVTA